MATRYLLDGNILTQLEDRTKPSYKAVRDKLASLSSDDEVYISILSVYEYQDGIANASGQLSEHLKDRVRRFSIYLKSCR